MFDDIEQLEKEIETFRGNIAASSELVEGIIALSEATRQHKEAYTEGTEQLLSRIDDCISEITDGYDSAARSLSTQNETLVNGLQEKLVSEQQTRIDELRQISAAAEASNSEAIRKADTLIGQLAADCEGLLGRMEDTAAQQNAAYCRSTSEAVDKIQSGVTEIKANQDAAIAALLSNSTAFINECRNDISDQLNAYISELGQIKAEFEAIQAAAAAECKNLLSDMKEEHEALNSSYTNAAADSISKLSSIVSEIKAKFEAIQADAADKSEKQINQLAAECKKLLSDMKKEHEALNSSYTGATNETIKKLTSIVSEIKAENKTNQNTLSNSNAALAQTLQQNITAELQARVAELKQIRSELESIQAQTTKKMNDGICLLTSECDRLVSEMKASVSIHQTAHSEKLAQTERIISGYQAEAESKYKDFVQKIEHSNIDQIYNEMQSLKRSVNTKFGVLFAGIGLTLAAAVLNFIMK